VVSVWQSCREQIAACGGVVLEVPLGLGVVLLSLVMMLDLPKPNSVLDSRLLVYIARFVLL